MYCKLFIYFFETFFVSFSCIFSVFVVFSPVFAAVFFFLSCSAYTHLKNLLFGLEM